MCWRLQLYHRQHRQLLYRRSRVWRDRAAETSGDTPRPRCARLPVRFAAPPGIARAEKPSAAATGTANAPSWPPDRAGDAPRSMPAAEPLQRRADRDRDRRPQRPGLAQISSGRANSAASSRTRRMPQASSGQCRRTRARCLRPAILRGRDIKATSATSQDGKPPSAGCV